MDNNGANQTGGNDRLFGGRGNDGLFGQMRTGSMAALGATG